MGLACGCDVLDPIVGHLCDLEPTDDGQGVRDAKWVRDGRLEGSSMKIVQVEYRRLRTFGNYENETVGATALVADGEVADAVFETVRRWVDNRLGDDKERRDLDRRVTELRWQERDLKARIERMQAKWSEIMAFLERFGIERPGDVPADLSEILSPDDRSWEEDQDLKTLPF